MNSVPESPSKEPAQENSTTESNCPTEMSASDGVAVVVSNLLTNPSCVHGPAQLFQAFENNQERNFFACSACRDRKDCSLFLWADEVHTYRRGYWERQAAKYRQRVNHKRDYHLFVSTMALAERERMYCFDCCELELPRHHSNHLQHKHVRGISEELMKQPSRLLPPLENAKCEAQYLFNEDACEFITDTLQGLKYKYVLCLGTPRLHEYIVNNCPLELESLLMDIDARYASFYSPLNFVWYNYFNHHFFQKEGQLTFEAFLTGVSSRDELVVVMDPPFGARIELLHAAFEALQLEYKRVSGQPNRLPIFLVMPYFMEPIIHVHLRGFVMLDYKVGYENHKLFTQDLPGKPCGSPVRIFTNVPPKSIKLPTADSYRYCNLCHRWVAPENIHCYKCKACTSKNGSTYMHCDRCERCVKPTWKHCENCERCAPTSHKCGEIAIRTECVHCKEVGHKKSDCPVLAKEQLKLESAKRKSLDVIKSSKRGKKK